MKINLLVATLVATVAALIATPSASAQDNIWSGNNGNWSDATWNQGGPPLLGLDARAIIGSTVGSGSPTAVVSVTSSEVSPTVVLGDGGGTNGTLNITSTGTLAVQIGGSPVPSAGDFDVGLNGGLGMLHIAAGGALDVDGELRSTSGAPASTISLDGTAMLSAGSANLDRNLIINGSNVDFSVDGNLILGLAGTHSWVIPASGAATLSVGGNADLGGTLKVEFPDGTPAVGTTWNLVDAATVDDNEAIPSGFSFVDTSAVGGLAPGARFATRTVPNASNGVFGQLVLEQHPVLMVDRNTGEVTISNPGPAASIEIDTYVVTSNLAALNPDNWQTLAPDDGWAAANPKPTQLSELNPVGATGFSGNSDSSLGQVFAPPTPAMFGQENEDIRFRYSKPGGGFIEGEVLYTGVPNNTLTLVVDPLTGEASIVNGTQFTVAIDNYNVLSESGSLNFADGSPAATWNSLEDQGADGGNWFEANVSENMISELLVAGGRTLAPNDVIEIGTPFDTTAGQQDLEFTFALLQTSDGDFNGDGSVNLADYTVWRDNLGASETGDVLSGNGNGGTVDATDYTLWKNNFGNSGGGSGAELLTGKVVYETFAANAALSSSNAVPEPTTCLLTLASLVGLLVAKSQRRGD